MPIKLNKLEHEVMEMLLMGDDPLLEVLREQYKYAHATKREYTGVGFYLTFSVPNDIARLENRKSFHFGDIKADIDGLKYGAGFVLHGQEGSIDFLEGYTYDEPWPTYIKNFELSYINGNERNLNALRNNLIN